ncbi:recombinase family protein [Micromonospora carbonacea]|uniref:Site-specific DNA recombinase n=1 Tax=Micromonospora carbonacea TaxID=47853 RepID=A0A1C4ZJB7_9ACTN|nr:recombinase family protein [Micromonospora carbonacea]SCF33160.1 Site-specific DNA recombinase [Micromonospora carbonacea]
MTGRRPLRASLYVRLSKAADERNLSKQGMVDDLRRLCTAHGFAEVALHVDDGASGGIRNRPAFKAWLADATEGHADVLVAWHVDRLSREGLNVAAVILDVIEGKDPETGQVVRPPVRLIGFYDRLDSADGEGFRLNFLIKAELARAELSRMKSRAQARVRRMRKEKRAIGGLTPYGYQRAARGSLELEHDPVSAPILQDMVRRVIDGASVGSVARDLNARGVLSPRDHAAMRDTGQPRKNKETGEPLPRQAWTDETVRRMLTNPVLLGCLTEDKKIVRNGDGSPVRRGEALISDDEWAALQGTINGAKRPKTRKAPDALLSGEVNCPECGSVLHYHYLVKPDRKQEYKYYRCAGRTRKGNGCTAAALRAEELEQAVTDFILTTFGDLEIMKKVYVPGDDVATRLAEVEERLSELREDRKAGLYRGEQGAAEFREMYASLEQQREELEALPSRPEGWKYIPSGRTYRQQWNGADTVGRRKTLNEAGVKIWAAKCTTDNASEILTQLQKLPDPPQGLIGMRDGIALMITVGDDIESRLSGNPDAVAQWGPDSDWETPALKLN